MHHKYSFFQFYRWIVLQNCLFICSPSWFVLLHGCFLTHTFVTWQIIYVINPHPICGKIILNQNINFAKSFAFKLSIVSGCFIQAMNVSNILLKSSVWLVCWFLQATCNTPIRGESRHYGFRRGRRHGSSLVRLT